MSNIQLTLGDTSFFPEVNAVVYEGPTSDNPFAYKWYNPEQIVAGKTMSEHLRFAVCYWHTFCNTGGDPFGVGTKKYPWSVSSDPIQAAKDKMDAAFEFISKLGLGYYCFHDYDLVDEAETLAASEKRVQAICDYAKEKQAASGIKLLWGTANLFGNARYMNGAITNPDFKVVAHAGAQVKIALDATMALNGENYVFWGGREGYMSLLNTDMKREVEHLGRFFIMARDYARKQGFTGQFFIEPKPFEPSKHQYDFDAATCIGFLRQFDLLEDFSLNLEVNHATLASHSFQHELQVAADANVLGSIDANRGDYQNGWDTDQFPNSIYELVEALLVILPAGGFKGGGVNFDAKTRRNSTDLADIFHAHIGGIDAFAKALLVAENILSNSPYNAMRTQRYASFDSGDGNTFEQGQMDLESLYKLGHEAGHATGETSGQQELYENLINDYLFR